MYKPEEHFENDGEQISRATKGNLFSLAQRKSVTLDAQQPPLPPSPPTEENSKVNIFFFFFQSYKTLFIIMISSSNKNPDVISFIRLRQQLKVHGAETHKAKKQKSERNKIRKGQS